MLWYNAAKVLFRKIVFHSLTGQVKKHTQYWNERYFVLIVVLCNIFPAIVSIHIHKCFSESGPYLSPFHYFFFRAGFVSDPNWTLRVTSTGKNVIKFFYKEMKIPLICLAVTCRYVGRISVVFGTQPVWETWSPHFPEIQNLPQSQKLGQSPWYASK